MRKEERLRMYSNRKVWKRGSFLMAMTARGTRLGAPLLLFFALLLGAAHSAQAAGVMCSQFWEGGVQGVVDGYDPNTYAAIASASTFGIDMNCTIKNFPESMGGFPITNINFQFWGNSTFYIDFENVYYYGNMSCNNPSQATFWIYWAPGGYNNISPSCQTFMVPVDATIKQDPPAQTTATIGVPFTYTITAPYLGKLDQYGVFQYIATADTTDIRNVVITDDLTQGNTAALSYVSNIAYLVNTTTGARTPLGSLTPGASSTWLTNHLGISSDSTKHLVFSYEYNSATLSDIPAGDHIEIDLTVVLDNNTTTNYPGETFTNTVNMWFNKTINSTSVTDLQAWPSTTPPMTIVGPNLVVRKSSTVTNLNVGSTAPFKIDVQNTGGSTAWDATITDDIPQYMCQNPPTSFTAQLYASDGTTLISNLVQGTDYSYNWTGPTASSCQFTLTMLDTSANQIGPNQHLIINYGAQLDAGTPPGQALTNIAGATQWYSASNSYTNRHWYGPNTLTNGTPGVLDFQDAYTIYSTTTGYFFLKSVTDLITGISEDGNSSVSAFPGDKLRYTLQIQNFQVPELDNITIIDDLGVLNASAAFVSGISIYSSTLPGTATVTTCPSCGTNGVPKITISNLNLPGNTQYQIQFDVTLASNLTNGAIVNNQASLTGTNSSGPVNGVSDDPYVNGPSQISPTGDITPITIQAPGALSKTSPSPSTATIGQQFSYTITVPATPTNVPLYDVKILDTLPANVSFVSAQVSSGGTWNVTNTGTSTSLVLQDTNTGIDIPSGGQAVIQVTVAMQNTTANTKGVSFSNSAYYTYNKVNGDISTVGTGGSGAASMTVVEPHLTAVKTVSYFSPAGKLITSPAASGDVLQYTVTIKNDGTSEAFDTDVMDFLPSNVSLVPGSATAQINGGPVSGFITTPTVLASGAVDWGSQNGDASLDIPVGGTLVLTYQVSVTEVNGTPITNSVYAAWTSLSGVITGERTGAGCPNWTSPNNYCTGPATTSVTSLDPTTLAKSVVSDTWSTAPSTSTDSTLRIGDTIVYSLALTLREGVTQNVVVTDHLPTGLAFDSLVSINPASGSSNFIYTVSSQPASGATGTLTWNLGNITNAVDNNPANNTLVIQYRARVVNNTLAQSPTAQQLTNNATLNYAINNIAATPKTASATINVWQPMLSVSKSAAPAGGGTVITAGEFITYTVNLANSGAAPAYNPVLTDTLPVGLRQAGVTTTSITLINTATNAVVATLPTLAPTYSSTTGVATWNFDVAASPDLYAIPPGDTLQVVYQVTADSTLGAGMTLVNNALVQYYYSFDSLDVPTNSTVANRQVYGPTGAATVQLTTASATALSKQNLVTTAAIGQPFTYSITIPATPQPTAMYDVRILDNLSSAVTGVDMSFVSVQRVSGPAFTPVNTGTATNLVIQDTTNGIDIPAGQQIVVNVTVVLSNTTNNTLGKQFQNTATYTYDSVNNNTSTQANGAPGASGPITIVGPNLTMQKSGPGTMSTLAPGTFTLNVQNTGGSTAWQTTLTDILPYVTSPTTGGMCGSAPTNVTAQIYQSNGTTAVSPPLVNGTDFTVSFAGAPACTLTIAMKSSATAIPPTDRLIVTYSASLDPNTAGGITLTNIAGATQWLSADPAVTAPGNIQTLTGPLTNGTPGVLDNQDAFTVTTQAPSLTFTKTVYDVTTGQSGANARPGDTLQYTLTIQNAGALGASNFTLTDELDKLNTTAMFVPGSLKLVTVPAGANTSLTSTTGGSKGTGLVSISNLSITPQGQTGDTLVIQFQATLVPVINSGSLVLNQAQIGSSTLPTQLSDDPSITGTPNPTQTLITSAPAFRVLKTVQDITSGTSTVMAGDTLRYTITVKNVGTENATGVTLRDQVPSYTTYVANSTTLNGAAVADPSAGVSALQNGMLINSPANLTAGAMPANASTTTTNVATITFEVQISKNVVNGTLISNQGFVDGSGATSGPFPEQPSDNPATPVLNDPTTVVVGNLPLVYALKTVQLVVDNNGNGLVDPGDVLQYTITLTNSGATPATGVVLTDAVPANTTYVANSIQMNGAPVAQPDGGVSPLINGIGVVSSGLTPPSPPSSGGTLAAGGTGIVTFKVQVNAGVPPGTIISNQGSVATAQLPPLLTDSDGNPTNGYQPTVITVGNAQQLSITKSVVVVGGGAALPGSVLEYTIQATNVGLVAATNVVITDDLTPLAAQATYVANSATMNGSTNGVSFTSPVITANYSATYGTLAPGGSVVVRFDVKLNSTLASGITVTNTAQVGWNSPTQIANASASVVVGGIPGSASLNGFVWQDANFNNTLDSGEPIPAGWFVDLYQNGQLLGTVSTGADGAYHIVGVTPNAGTTLPPYELRFRALGAGSNTAMLGWASGPYSSLNGAAVTYGMQRISNIVVTSSDVLQNLNLPLTPNGVVYNSVTRQPIAGATLTMVQASSKTPLASSCFNDPAQQGQVTLSSGYYKFDLNFSDPSCPSSGEYLIQVTPPASGYSAGPSQLIPPTSSSSTATFSVPNCPGSSADAVPSTPECEAQVSDLAPSPSVPAGSGTAYYLHLTLAQDTTLPAASQIYNNHIAIDPPLNTIFGIQKKALLLNVTRGQMVPYEIDVQLPATLPPNLVVVDHFPAGFKYVDHSARLDGSPLEPVKTARELRWGNLTGGPHTIKFLLVVGAGVKEGDYVNNAQVINGATGEALSGIATATVRIVPDPTFDCTDIIGKVFDDANGNGYPDPDEKGLPGVRIVSARGLIATTDKYGRFHITCAAVPNEDRGSNFILKLDDRTLPSGYRLTTENPLVQRVTSGKAIKFNFGATLDRVVSLDIADGVFEPGSTEMRPQWKPRIEMLLSELRKAPSILRISYLADVEDPKIVKARTEAVKREIAERWGQGSYELKIETEIFWRRGGPPAISSVANDGQLVSAAVMAETNTAAVSVPPAASEPRVSATPALGQAVEKQAGTAISSVANDGQLVSTVVMAETNTAAVSAPPAASEPRVSDAPPLGQAVERQAGTDEPRTLWALGGNANDKQGDKVEVKKVLEKAVKTIKLQNLVAPIHFASGEAEIPEGYVQRLRDVLDSMKGRNNVRLHFVGYTDNAQLFGAVKQKYGDNLGLSRERAGTVAEYFQKALHLPPESITYEGMGESHPVASNATEQGKALNRRVEVEVWYDEITDKLVDKEVVVAEQMNRVKVCRVETVCKLRYKEGHSKRARIKNLVEPLHFDDDTTAVPEDFVQKVRQALTNLRTKQHVVVKFIGYTDNLPLSGRAERIYGNAVALSKARARRVALAIQDALKLPTSGIEVDGKGAANPIASNDTEKGRALNRRIEVEFWYDDALQELSDEPQLCPEAAGAETVTRVYDSPSGGVKPILFEQGKPVITPEQLDRMRSSMDEIRDKTNVRLRFIGYTNDERLERRTAMVYGDDIGLSTARARRAMDAVKEQLGLKDEQVEFEGRGYVQSDDVVNTGFVESDTARVEVQVVYDELMALDDTEGLDITRLTREVTPKDPLALNLMRISVDGKPIDDPNMSIADIERCTDVALDKANVQFKFDNLDLKPRLNVTAWPNSIRYQDDPTTEYPENLMRFRTYTNYAAFIKKSEIRIFDAQESVNDTPLAVIEVNKDGRAEWQPTFPEYKAPGRELKYVLRVYDAENHFDETKPLPIWIVDKQSAEIQDHDVEKELLVGYGENHLAVDNIPKKGGTIKVYGSAIPADHSVFVAGSAVPVGKEGKFVTEEILPPGMHTVEVAVLDKAGNGDLFLRDLDLKKNDWFYVGIADVTVERDFTTGPAQLVTNDQTHYNNEFNTDGRLAFYIKGKFGEGWELTSSADSLEGPIKDIFSLRSTSPDSLFRSIDPKYYYPTFGDDGSVEEGAPTLGKFYLKLKKDESYGLWGDFKIGYNDNDLARVDRGLYGANAHYQSPSTTSFGEKRFLVDGFAAQPGTVGARDEFLGTGGSLYYLHHQNILTGSESVRIEVRDKDSGIVTAVKNLMPNLDYTVDYLQGRISLSQPLSPTASDNLLVSSDTVGGNPVYLVVRYEYEPSAGDTNSMSLGGRAHVWLSDYVKLGITSSMDRDSDNPNGLNAADLTLRKSAETWVRVETSRSKGPGLTSLTSTDGGLTSNPTCPSFNVITNATTTTSNPACSYFGSSTHVSAGAYRVDTSIGFRDIIDGANGQLTLYTQSLDAGYSAPGLETATDTKQYGGTLKASVTDRFNVTAKADKTVRQQGLETNASEVDVNYRLTEHWTLSPGVRLDSREDHSPVVPTTQMEGDRTDAALRATYDSKERWSAYGFVQDTVSKTGNREDNGRVGSGGSYHITDRFKVNGEVSSGDLGGAGKVGTEYLFSDRTNIYLNYVYDNETPDNGIRSSKGNIVSGFKTRYSDSTSVYAEEKYTYGKVPTGLTHSAGVDLAPFDHWNFGVNVDFGTLRDPITAARLERDAAGVRVGYGNKGFTWASAFEYRIDKTETININPDGSQSVSTVDRNSWLIKNDIKYQIDDSSRLLGKLNHAESGSSGTFFGGNYTEVVIGYGYRPVSNDRLNTLFKYTYFYNVPTVNQVTDTVTYTATNTVTNTAADFIQKSHIFSLDAMYDLTQRWSIGGKYAYRLGQISEDQQSPVFFDSRASLYILRADWHFVHEWDALFEGRLLDLPDAGDRRSGVLVGIYRQLGNHIKFGVGYNFSKFSDDLTDLDYRHQGVFINVIGEM